MSSPHELVQGTDLKRMFLEISAIASFLAGTLMGRLGKAIRERTSLFSTIARNLPLSLLWLLFTLATAYPAAQIRQTPGWKIVFGIDAGVLLVMGGLGFVLGLYGPWTLLRTLLRLPPGDAERRVLHQRFALLQKEKLALHEAKKFEDALSKTESMLPILREDRAFIALAHAYRDCGRLCEEMGKDRRALPFYRSALQLFRRTNKVDDEADAHADIGRILLAAGEFKRSRKELTAASKLLKTTGATQLLPVLESLSEAYFSEKKPKEAREIAVELLSLAQKAEEQEGIASGYRILGVIDKELGDVALSVRELRQAEHLYEQLNLPARQISVLRHLAEAFRDQKQYDEARKSLDKALNLNGTLGDGREQCSLLTNWAALEIDTGETLAAGETLRSALDLARSAGFRYPQEATILYWIAHWYSLQENWQEAQRYAIQAADIFMEFNDLTWATLSQDIAGTSAEELFGRKLPEKRRHTRASRPGEHKSHAPTGDRYAFLAFVVNTVFFFTLVWCVLFYLSICFPHIQRLQVWMSIVFLTLPIASVIFSNFYADLLFKEYSEVQLRSKRWVVARWLADYVKSLLLIATISSVLYVAIKILTRFRMWPSALLAWNVHRIDAFLGICLGSAMKITPQGWLGGWVYALVSGMYACDVILLWAGIFAFAMVCAGADVGAVVEEKFKPALYGRLAAILRGSFVLAVLLTIGGALMEFIKEFGKWFGFKMPELNLDLILDVSSKAGTSAGRPLPAWIFVLHLSVVVTLIRVIVPRLYYVKQIDQLSWSPLFGYFGAVVLTIPLFFQEEAMKLPFAHFYDGYLAVVRLAFAAVYLMFFGPLLIWSLMTESQ